MATLRIELPDELVQQVRDRGFSQQHLEKFMAHLVEELLHELDEQSAEAGSSTTTTEITWTDGEAFARRLIADNRELFEELARL